MQTLWRLYAAVAEVRTVDYAFTVVQPLHLRKSWKKKAETKTITFAFDGDEWGFKMNKDGIAEGRMLANILFTQKTYNGSETKELFAL